MKGGASLEAALRPVLQKSWAANKQIVFERRQLRGGVAPRRPSTSAAC